MGMYTKFFLDTKFKRKEHVSDSDWAALEYLFDGKAEPIKLPDHPFFNLQRSRYMFNSPAYTGDAVTVKLSDFYGHVTAHIELKDYEGEIKQFLDWSRPLMDVEKGTVIGWTWYEEDDSPTLVLA